jgi:ABC-2 type transport system ATP-binding protein
VNAIEVRELTKRFGAFVAVDRLSFEVPEGCVFGLLGSNGAGKSTAIRILCGLLSATSGEARVLGVDVLADPERVKRSIGYMTQRFSLYEDLTVRQNLRFFGGVYGLRTSELQAREAWAVEMAGLKGRENASTGSLSGGWKQRLALACSVLHRPRVLFLDEPTAGVDPLSRRRFWTLIDAMAGEGVTVVVTTHYLDEAEHCDRIALMHAGRLVALGSVPELKQVFVGRAVLEVICPDYTGAMAAFEEAGWVHEVSVFGTRLHLVVDDLPGVRARVLEHLARAGNVPATVERIVPSLEDVFIHSVEVAEAARSGAA